VSAVTAHATAPLVPMVLRQARAEFLKLWRVPAFSATSMALPVMFYGFFGIAHSQVHVQGGVTLGAYFLASMGAYAVSNVMVFSFGIGVANERGQKMDLLMRASPLPPAGYLAAKVLMALLFGLITLLVLVLFAKVTNSISLGPVVLANLVWRLLLGSLPFIAVGFAFGYLAGPNSAVAVVNLVYLPTAFASGIFIPVNQLPDWISRLSPYLPLYRYVDISWQTVGYHTGQQLAQDWLYLAVFTVVFFGLAVRAYRRDTQRKFS
jgi:ABC-2 type transport system permease protein